MIPVIIFTISNLVKITTGITITYPITGLLLYDDRAFPPYITNAAHTTRDMRRTDLLLMRMYQQND